ncbi:MAG: hypothetical protein ACWA6U_09105 [Breznakibacter sp.]
MDTKKMMMVLVAEADVDLFRKFLLERKVQAFDEIDAQHYNVGERPPHRVDNWFGAGALPSNHRLFLWAVNQPQSDRFIEDMNTCRLDGSICFVRIYRFDVEVIQ